MSRRLALPTPGLPVPSALAGILRDPLLRNGHALVLSSVTTTGIGLLYWVIAAHRSAPATLGRNTAAISALMFLGGVAQLNLLSALTRFVQPAGASTTRLVRGIYLLSASVAVVLGVSFLVLIPHVDPSLGFLTADRRLAAWFVLSTAVWAIFVLEDGVLTGLRRAVWVPVENTGYALLKCAMVIPLAASLFSGVFLSWTAATLLTIIPTNLYLFRRAIPRHERNSPTGSGVSVAELLRFVPYDYLGSLFWLGLTSLLPLFVVRELGPAANAFFSLAWVIAYGLHLVSINIGYSLVAETAVDQSELEVRVRHVLAHLAKLLVPAVIVVVLGAPELLGLFGHPYAAAGTTTLRLLALSALPFIVTATAVAAARARRQTSVVGVVNAAMFVLVFSITWALMRARGITAVGEAWLTAQLFVAVSLLVGRRLWLGPVARRGGKAEAPRSLSLGPSGIERVAIALARQGSRQVSRPAIERLRVWPQRRRAWHEVEQILPALGPAWTAVGSINRARSMVSPGGRSASDLTVALLRQSAGSGPIVVKIPRSEQGAADLRRQRDVLRALASDPRLGGWAALLPACELQQVGHRTFALETAFDGTDAATVLRAQPARLTAIRRAGLEVVDELHRRTARRIVVDEATMTRWVDEPVALLRSIHPSGSAPVAQRLAADRVAARLRAEVAGRRITVSWLHGDFTPGNVILCPGGERVSGIIDWGQARPNGISALDVSLWVAAIHCQSHGQQLGQLVREVLEGAEWPELDGAPARGPGATADRGGMGDTGLDPRTLLLWSWLEHVGCNLRKSPRYRRHRLWWANNVDSVLAWFATEGPMVA